jgi:hypothetical protein
MTADNRSMTTKPCVGIDAIGTYLPRYVLPLATAERLG